jgi:hypothetical protein
MMQIKKSVGGMDEDERLYLLHYLKHLLRVQTEANRRELARLHDEVAAGKKVTLAQLKRLDKAFRAEGL